jgi:hypothetical protein
MFTAVDNYAAGHRVAALRALLTDDPTFFF